MNKMSDIKTVPSKPKTRTQKDTGRLPERSEALAGDEREGLTAFSAKNTDEIIREEWNARLEGHK